MRRLWTVLLLIAALVLLVGVAGCTSDDAAGATTSPEAQDLSLDEGDGGAQQDESETAVDAKAQGDMTPEQILAEMLTAAQDLAASTILFEAEITVDLETGDVPEEVPDELAQLFEEPIRISGGISGDFDSGDLDSALTVTMMGQPIELALKVIDTDMWMSLGGRWYEFPADMLEELEDDSLVTDDRDPRAISAEVFKLLEEMEFDPATWFEELTLVGEEEIEGVPSYHLTGTPDVVQATADIFSLIENEELLAIFDSNGSMGDSLEGAFDDLPEMPGPDELAEYQDFLASVVKKLDIDLWVSKADFVLTKISVDAAMGPPPGEDPEGVDGIYIKASMMMKDWNTAVTVTPPASARPIETLSMDIERNPEMLGPLGPMFMEEIF